ncbi:MAG: GspE/PulE family protein [Candidatus Eremiobacteraeota bacterium]|nr:GspE/PulE family protein [Candidatus Eremiobacteraeota bacterium]
MDRIKEKIPIDFLQRNLFLPLEENGDLKLGVCSESNLEAIEDLRLILQIDLEPLYMKRDQIDMGLRDLLVQDIGSGSDDDDDSLEILEEETQDLLSHSRDAPIIKLVNSLFLQSLQRRGTDIHIEPYEADARVRIRTDGELHETMTISKNQYTGVCARVKVMARLNLAEHRLPQDGRMRVKAGDNALDVRVSILPTQFGERIVLRILDRGIQIITLENLGLLKEDYVKLRSLISHPYGSILITGPTGSGKSTTLYAMIQEIKSPRRNIITIEDPVEYQIEGIGQIPVNAKIGITFASGLRSILRQDPDVIMVGEIRDPETADIVTHASLTGHLVLSTLHTNDAPTAVSRLVDMGVESYLISSSVIGIIAQRLVRRLCPSCKEPYTPRESELRGMNIKSPPSTLQFYRQRDKGCQDCLGTGFHGRVAIFEIMVIDEDLKSAIIRSPEANVIRKIARDNGMENLMDDGVKKVIKGVTTMEEVLRATTT